MQVLARELIENIISVLYQFWTQTILRVYLAGLFLNTSRAKGVGLHTLAFQIRSAIKESLVLSDSPRSKALFYREEVDKI